MEIKEVREAIQTLAPGAMIARKLAVVQEPGEVSRVLSEEEKNWLIGPYRQLTITFRERELEFDLIRQQANLRPSDIGLLEQALYRLDVERDPAGVRARLKAVLKQRYDIELDDEAELI